MQREGRTVVHDLIMQRKRKRVGQFPLPFLLSSEHVPTEPNTHSPQRHQCQHLNNHRQRSSHSTSRRALQRVLPIDLALENDSRSGDGDSSREGESEEEGSEEVGLEEREGLVGCEEESRGGVGEERRGEGYED